MGRKQKELKFSAWLIQGICVMFLLVIALWKAGQTGILSDVGSEDVYWERARFILGQGGASLYTGSSMCSLGYSLILVPLCALLKSSYAAYKAAVLLNAVFLCLAYFAATRAARELFPDENSSFLCLACLFAVFCPAMAGTQSYTGPEMAVLFLMWVSVYLMVKIWKTGRLREQENGCWIDWLLLAGCMILIGFLQIAALGTILAVTVWSAYCVKKNRMSGNTFLAFVLILFLGLAAGNIAERVFLSCFSADMDISVIRSSLEAVLDEVFQPFEAESLFSSLAGKLYSVMIGSFLLICPAVWYFFRQMFGKISARGKEKPEKDEVGQEFPLNGITGIFLAQMFWMSLCDRNGSAESMLLSVSGLEMVLSLVILMGIVRFRHLDRPEKELAGYLFALCILALLVAGTFQNTGVDYITGTRCGIFTALRIDGNLVESAEAVIMVTCLVFLAVIVFFVLFCGRFGRKWLTILLRSLGFALGIALFAALNIATVSLGAGAVSADYLRNIAPIASLISETGTCTGCLYISGSDSDEMITVLQSLLPEEKILVLENTTQARELFYNNLEQEAETQFLLTGALAGEITAYEENLPGYRIIYISEYYALWAKQGSEIFSEAEERVELRRESVALASEKTEESTEESETEAQSETEEISVTVDQDLSVSLIYGGDLVLAPGTYQAEISVYADSIQEMEGTITICEGDTVITDLTVTQEEFDENGYALLQIEFSGRDVMRGVTLTLSGTMAEKSSVNAVYLQKQNARYTIAANDDSKLKKTTKLITKTDALCGVQGTVAYVDRYASDTDEISTEILEELLPDYEVTVVTEEGLNDLDADYLIGLTTDHAYFGAMDRYSVISRGAAYTILVRNDSLQYQACEEAGTILSNGTSIYMSAFSSEQDSDTSIKLERGDYKYHVRLEFDPELVTGEASDIAAIVYILNGEDILVEQEITNEELLEGTEGVAEISVPLNLLTKKKKVTCVVEMTGSIPVLVTPLSIELVSETCQFGKEEDLSEICELICSLEKGTNVYVAQTTTIISARKVMYTWLQELLPDCTIQEITYSEARGLTGDAVLLTWNFYSGSTLLLLQDYDILCQAGQYTLWVKNDGAYLNELVSEKAVILNSGTKVSPASVAAMAGTDAAEGAIAWLPAGKYRIYLKLTADGLDPDDTVEVYLYRDKIESEVEAEREDLVDSGYTEEEADRLISLRTLCGSTSLGGWQFLQTDSLLTSVAIGNAEIFQLTCEAFTWYGKQVEAEILWIEQL
ncbi:MAG: hypothetical protein LUD18_15085 [Lachnospiraceae bacterium]|nr:hypothetical protein [Lachnospiraceae bacterium]